MIVVRGRGRRGGERLIVVRGRRGGEDRQR